MNSWISPTVYVQENAQSSGSFSWKFEGNWSPFDEVIQFFVHLQVQLEIGVFWSDIDVPDNRETGLVAEIFCLGVSKLLS